ncbi:vitamin B12 dependent-methionine synthase activation domain-containing protein, partial [Rhodoferax sp.]|uniref:vitamin B12 dependent-methionine synthase activation domain-containing protein n=1 Tax=Rhodoferax sp. TaxID=50421 RepID=UPI0026170090
YPAILDDEVVGTEAKKVFADGQAMLKKIIEGRWLTANGVVGLYPANRVGDDDIALYADETRSSVALTWYGLRQQAAREQEDDGSFHPNRCLADFVAPTLATSKSVAANASAASATGIKDQQKSNQARTGQPGAADHVGVFAVTTGLGIEKHEARFLAAHDDYSAIMLKAIADRLAEAFAECLHRKVRTDLWGYAPAEALNPAELIAEQYQGIRPAPGYPACPDHSVKKDMFALLQCEDIGMTLTESLAMAPAASVSGFYLSHPQASYFNVGRIGEDQLKDLASRRGLPERELQRLLAPHL